MLKSEAIGGGIVMDGQERGQRQRREVDANFQAFEEQLPELLKRYAGKHALMKDCKVVEIFDTDLDAMRAGYRLFEDGIFSVQKISREIIDLGFVSHEVCLVSSDK